MTRKEYEKRFAMTRQSLDNMITDGKTALIIKYELNKCNINQYEEIPHTQTEELMKLLLMKQNIYLKRCLNATTESYFRQNWEEVLATFQEEGKLHDQILKEYNVITEEAK